MPPSYLPLQQGHFIGKVGDDQLFAKNAGKQVAACGTHRRQHTAQQKSQPWPKQGTSQNILQRKQDLGHENIWPMSVACPVVSGLPVANGLSWSQWTILEPVAFPVMEPVACPGASGLSWNQWPFLSWSRWTILEPVYYPGVGGLAWPAASGLSCPGASGLSWSLCIGSLTFTDFHSQNPRPILANENIEYKPRLRLLTYTRTRTRPQWIMAS